jgi:hypothetical protein
MPGVSGVTVVTNARVYYTTRAAAGASGARHSLRPLIAEGGNFKAKLGCIAPRECGIVSHFVIDCDKRKAFAQGSTCDEAIHCFLLCGAMDCFASSGAHSRDRWLAMTVLAV